MILSPDSRFQSQFGDIAGRAYYIVGDDRKGNSGNRRSRQAGNVRFPVLRFLLVHAFLLLSIVALASPSQDAVPTPDETIIRTLAECPELGQAMGADGSFLRLDNPILGSEAEVERTVESYKRLVGCLSGITYELPASIVAARVRASLFLDFADPDEDPATVRRELVALATTPDAAIARLREEVGFRPPAGLVYLKYYPSRDLMPDAIRAAFNSPSIRAVTMSCRYIAVLDQPQPTRDRARLTEESLATTVSHELVHAFLQSTLCDANPRMELPAWFHEGFAIYFSGSGTSHVMLDRATNTIYRVEATDEYEEYERTFLYLESRFNERDFYDQLRNTVDLGDVAGLFDAVGMSSHEELRLTANFWWRWWPISEMTGWFYLLWFLPIPPAIYLLWRHRRKEPLSQSPHRSALDIELFDASPGGDHEFVRRLLDMGADPNAPDRHGWTPLMFAVMSNDVDTVEMLLDEGADPEAGIPVARAMDGCDQNIIRLLLDARLRREE